MHQIFFRRIYIWLSGLLLFPAFLAAQTIPSYQPDRSLRKEIKKATLAELLPQTPSAYRGAIQMAFIGNLPFNDYEKVVQENASADTQNTIYLNAQGQFAWKTVKGGDTNWKPIYSVKETAGTYTLNKYAITLHYNNGRTEQYTFFFYPKKRDTFVIGTNHFCRWTNECNHQSLLVYQNPMRFQSFLRGK